MKYAITNFLIFVVVNMLFVYVEDGFSFSFNLGVWLFLLVSVISPINVVFLYLLNVLGINKWLFHSPKGVFLESVMFASLWRVAWFVKTVIIGDKRFIYESDGSITENYLYSDICITALIYLLILFFAYLTRRTVGRF